MKLRMITMALTLAVTGIVGLDASPASAGCNINVELHNLDNTSTVVDWHDSKVKVRLGTWKRLGSGTSTISGGDTLYAVVNTTFNCGADRRWQFRFEQGGNSQTVYEPSSSGWTDDQTIHVHANFP